MRSVLRNVRENRTIHTLYFRDYACSSAKPGQFVMVWAPGYDEMPMSLSGYDEKGLCSITVKPWGLGTMDLIGMKPGSVLGVRGPYGVPFTVEKCNALLVGGGTGLAPLLPLAKELVKVGSRVTLIIGGKSRSDILFERRARRVIKSQNLFITTDDGTAGTKGMATDIVEDLIKKRSIGRMYACGPEVMMRKCYDMALDHGIQFEASLERGMKCGFGICGSCTIGPYLLCRDGPVLNGKMLTAVQDEFGLLQRDHSGRYVKV
jgi:dihydroorotate dehydrogenase electron transfer subunit